ncbi:hypothetical protein LSH36_317g03026 [Paralvinella palmiformis]|uniref:Uncharacterized protein n=1 Tax=Paralvinella palmiformis TaxID=53620 RepID=A0AAD9N3E4_9ANNE|nr:hypothetical protein LSH36_317g03026 [Paralvinella palmiformis]
MGSCYSHQSQHQGKYSQPLEQPAKSSDNHSSMMPHPTAASEAGPDKARAVGTATQKGRQSGFGFRMPHMGRYNNNKPSRRGTEPSGIDEQNSTATNMSNGDGEGKTTDRCIKEPLIKSANKRNKARDKGRPRDNGFAASSESLTSLSSNGRGRGSKLSSKQSSLKRAYIPRSNTSSWRMIDDSSSAYSGKSGDKLLDRNNRSENTTPGLSLDDLSNGNTTASSTPAKAALIIKAPIAIVESLETLSGGSKEDAASRNPSPRKASDISSSYDKGSRVNRATAGSFQSRLRGPFKKYGPVTSTSKPEAKQTNQLSIGSQGNKWVKAKPEQNKNAGKRVIPNRAILQKQKSIDQELPEKEIIPQVDIKTTNPVNGIKVGKSKTAKLISSEDDIEKEISVIKEEPVKPVHTKPSSQVPALSPDALDTISIGSINSDDLMLDIDLDEYEELGSPPSMEPSKHSRTRSRSRSRSRENPHRKSLNGGSNEKSTDKCAGPKEQSESGIPAPQTKLVCMGPLKELATLVQVSNASVPTTTQR